MNIKELRIGNLIKVNPRENQEGLLAITEIQKETIIGEMISPRPGYHFRIKFDEINLIPVTEEWLLKAGFIKDAAAENIWKDSKGLFDFHFDNQQNLFVDGEKRIGKKAVEFVNELQNGYQFLSGEELSINA